MTYVINNHRLPEPAVVIAIEPQGPIDSDDVAGLLRDRFSMVLVATRPARIVVDRSAVPSLSDDGLDALRSGSERAAEKDASVTVVAPSPDVAQQVTRHGLSRLLERSGQR